MSRYNTLYKVKRVPVSVAGVPVVYFNVTDPELFYGIGPDLCLVDSRKIEAKTVVINGSVSWKFVKEHA